MRSDWTRVGILFVVVTALAALGAAIMDPFPTAGAEEADFIDEAFRVMTYMAAPVFGLVVALLVYSAWRFRTPGTPQGDGPPIQGTGAIPKIWFAASTVLAVVVMIYPGITGLIELRSDQTADLEVNITGQSWFWSVEYPESGVRLLSLRGDELMLPADRRIQFNVQATDVLHSFWIPAFRMKVDAVPGQTTQVWVTPTHTGDRASDVAYRLQCAELCGLDHSDMVMNVRVVEAAEFDEWLESRVASAARVP